MMTNHLLFFRTLFLKSRHSIHNYLFRKWQYISFRLCSLLVPASLIRNIHMAPGSTSRRTLCLIHCSHIFIHWAQNITRKSQTTLFHSTSLLFRHHNISIRNRYPFPCCRKKKEEKRKTRAQVLHRMQYNSRGLLKVACSVTLPLSLPARRSLSLSSSKYACRRRLFHSI